MTRMTPFSSPLMLGFDTMEKTLERIAKGSEGYPPYNIERIRASADGNKCERLRITLAVAGFCDEDLEVTTKKTSWLSEDGNRTMTGVNICIVASPHGNSSGCSFWPTAWRSPTPN